MEPYALALLTPRLKERERMIGLQKNIQLCVF